MIELNQILGQDAVLASLRTAYTGGRLPHGLIFAGRSGVGKFTTAVALGKLFLCERPDGFHACGACGSCRLVQPSPKDNTHPDLHFVFRELIRQSKSDAKARDLSTDVVRDFLIAKAANKSVQGVGKVFLVRDADRMSTTAQNALLKTLEEPAGRTLIVLLTSSPDALLPTIHSRCQLFRFALLETKLIEDQLRLSGINPADARAAAVVVDGSLGMAQRWLADGVVSQVQRMESLLQAVAAGKATPISEFFKDAADAYAENELKRDERASKDQATREGMAMYFNLAARWFSRQLPDAGEAAESYCAAIDALVNAENLVESNVTMALVLLEIGTALPGALAPSPGQIRTESATLESTPIHRRSR